MARHKLSSQSKPAADNSVPLHLKGKSGEASYDAAKARYSTLQGDRMSKMGEPHRVWRSGGIETESHPTDQKSLRVAIRNAKAEVREALARSGRVDDSMYVGPGFWRKVERDGFDAAEKQFFGRFRSQVSLATSRAVEPVREAVAEKSQFEKNLEVVSGLERGDKFLLNGEKVTFISYSHDYDEIDYLDPSGVSESLINMKNGNLVCEKLPENANEHTLDHCSNSARALAFFENIRAGQKIEINGVTRSYYCVSLSGMHVYYYSGAHRDWATVEDSIIKKFEV